MATATKVAFVTGGAGDIGFASAQKMGDMGMDLALLDRKLDAPPSAEGGYIVVPRYSP